MLAGGEPVSLCKGLSLEVAFGDTELDSSSLRRYAVHLSAEGKRIAQVPASGGVFSIEAISRELSPGLHRLVAELCPEGTERAITRSSTLVWTGLERQAENGVLHCSAWPQNLVASGCENASLSRENGQIGPRVRIWTGKTVSGSRNCSRQDRATGQSLSSWTRISGGRNPR